MKRIVGTVAVTAVAVVVSIALSVGVASAWHPVVIGQPTCSDNGSWTVYWTVDNGETVAGHVMTFVSVDVNGVALSLSPTSVAPGGAPATGTSTQSSAENSATITVNARWTFTTPPVLATVSATVSKPAACTLSGSSTIASTTTTTIAETTTSTVLEVTTIAAPNIQGGIAVRIDDTTQPAPEVEAVQVSAAAAASAQLPATGGVSIGLVGAGSGLLLVGVGLVAASRRRASPLGR